MGGTESGRPMTLGKHEPLTWFDIYEPRWHDKKVLLKASKVKEAKTTWLKVTFSKAPTMEGSWVISKAKALTYPLETNGTIQCRAIPLEDLHVLEINDKDMRGLI